MFGDDIVKSSIPATKQLIDFSYKHHGNIVLATQEIEREEISKYSNVQLKEDGITVKSIVEKPEIEDTTSNLVSFGRYILNQDVIKELAKRNLGKNNELWLTDAISRLTYTDKVLATEINGKWLTTGDPLNFLKTTLEYAKENLELWTELKDYVNNI